MPKFQPGNPGGPGRPKGAVTMLRRADMTMGFLMSQVKDKASGRDVPFVDAFLKQVQESILSGRDDKYGASLLRAIISEDVLQDIENRVDRERASDRDFLGYRVFNMAHDVQQEILLSKKRRKYLMAGRRAGKTEEIIFEIVRAFIYIDDARVLYIGKTITAAIDLIYQKIIDRLTKLGIPIDEHRRGDGYLRSGKRECYIKGNSSVEEREKLRGQNWDVIIIDEMQSQTALVYLIESILEPELLDRRGTLILSGTGPRVRGTYWESLWLNDAKAYKKNWNLTDNPFIPDHETVLATIREEKGLKESDPLYVREYLGGLAYDDDALVYRLNDNNYYTDDQLLTWIKETPRADLCFTGGLDYGWTDSDAHCVILYAHNRPERWLVSEYKKNREGADELAASINAALRYIQTDPLYKEVYEKDCKFYADTNEGRTTHDLASKYGIPVLPAYKADKRFAVEMLQSDVRSGMFKVRKGGTFEDEALKTVFARDDKDNLTREIDEDTYHADLVMAVIYAMRRVWLFEDRKQLGGT